MEYPKLKTIIETVIKVDYDDLNNFIQEVTGQKDYNCVESEEWSNDSQHRYQIIDSMDPYHLEKWKNFKAGKGPHAYMLYTILDGLCKDKHIQPGIYIITVSW
jgi:hypothetical protein